MYFKIDNTHWLHTYSSTKVRRFSRACVGAGGLFLNAKEAAPLSDDIIPKPGIYVNANDNYYPNMYGLVIVIKFHSSMILEIHVSGAAHQVKTRRHDGESWNEWA